MDERQARPLSLSTTYKKTEDMADSEHTLHLIAKLDTGEVKQQLDKLNSGKQQQSQAHNESYSSRYFNNIIPAALTGLSKTLHIRFTGESKKFSR